MDKTNYVLNKPELAANETVWAFDLGKGSIGSPGGVAPVDEFPGVAGVTPRARPCGAATNFCTRPPGSSRGICLAPWERVLRLPSAASSRVLHG